MSKIHPTAIVDPTAEIADGVTVGPYAIIEGDVKIGPGCVIQPHAIIRRYTTLGRENYVDCFCVFGGLPQAKCKTVPSRLKGSGMRWDLPNAEAMAALACVDQSNMLNQYWSLQRQRVA